MRTRAMVATAAVLCDIGLGGCGGSNNGQVPSARLFASVDGRSVPLSYSGRGGDAPSARTSVGHTIRIIAASAPAGYVDGLRTSSPAVLRADGDGEFTAIRTGHTDIVGGPSLCVAPTTSACVLLHLDVTAAR